MFGLGSSSQLGIGIAIRLHDQFSGTANRINQQLVAMRKNTNSALSQAITQYRNQSAAIAVGAGAASVGMYRLAEAGAKYQHSLNQIAIVSQGALSKDKMQAMVDVLSRQFTRTPQELAGVMFENVKAGVTKGIDEITRYQVATATATDEMLEGPEGVGAKLLGIMNAFRLNPLEQFMTEGGKSMSQFARVANAVTAAANSTMASVYDIGEAMEYFSNSAELSGMTLEQSLSIIGMLSQVGIRGSAAGTAANNMVQQLINSVSPLAGPKKRTALGMLGLNPEELRAMINQGRTFEALQTLSQAGSKVPRGDRLGIFSSIFNMRGSRGIVNAFAKAGDKTLGSISGDITKGESGDVVMAQAKAMTNDLYGEMKLLVNAFHSFRNAFATAVGPTLRVLLHGLGMFTRLLTQVLQTPLGKVLAGILMVLVPMVGIMFAFRAALLTATIALRGFGTSSSIGGFGQLLRGGLGMAGSAGLAGPLGAGLTRNAAGRWTVAAGQTVSHAGKIYKGGQLVPQALLATMGMGNAAGAAAGLGSKLGGFLGAAGPWISKGLGFMGRMLPIVGGVWMAVDLLSSLVSLTAKDKPKYDPLTTEYFNELDQMYFQRTYGLNRGSSDLNDLQSRLGAKKNKETLMNQNLQVNIDGFSAINQNMQQILNAQQIKDFNSKFHFEMPEM